MAHTAEKIATYADLEAVPPHLVAEILFGSLVTHPRRSPPHAVAATALGIELGSPFQKGRGGPGGWVFMVEPELHFGPHVVVPDLAAWRRERLPTMPETAYIETPPDWVCELISPSTQAHDRGPKRRIYASHGIRHLWHLDPNAKLLEVFELRDGQWLLVEVFQDRDGVGAPPFAAVPFSLGDLWPLDPLPAEGT
jgi:Uma2 family endonuclease